MMEKMTDALFQSAQGANALRGMEQFIRTLASPEGRKLLAHIGNGGGATLSAAATAAADAQNPAKTLINELMRTSDGSALLTELFAAIGGAKK